MRAIEPARSRPQSPDFPSPAEPDGRPPVPRPAHSDPTAENGARPIRFEGYRYYYRYFPGPHRHYAPLLFLGGAFQSMRSLKKFATVFRDRAGVILVDLPGSGDSDMPPPELGGDFLAGCVRHLLDGLALLRVNAIGVSFGTAPAYNLAQRYPERVEKLVLIGTMSRIDDRIRRALEVSFAALKASDMEAFADRVSKVLLNHDRRREIARFHRAERLLRAAIGQMKEREIEQFRLNGERLLLHERLDTCRRLVTPTLVLTGEHDTVTTPQHCREVARTAWESYLALVDRADHLVPLERFEICERLVDTFLRGGDLHQVSDCSLTRPARRS